MMDTTFKLTEIVRNLEGPIDLTFEWNGDPYSTQFESAATMLEAATTAANTTAEAEHYILQYWLTKDATLSDDAQILDKLLHVDPSASASTLLERGLSPTLNWAPNRL